MVQGGDTGGAPPASLMVFSLPSRLPYEIIASLIVFIIHDFPD
jgi:hypothetical protein